MRKSTAAADPAAAGAIEIETRRYAGVRVAGGDGAGVEYEIQADDLTEGELGALREAVEVDAGGGGRPVRLRAVGPKPERRRALFGLVKRTVRPRAELRVTVPRAFAVRIDAADARVSVDAVDGGVVARAGGLSCHGVAGGIQARVRGGHLRTGECRGPQELRVSGGSIMVWSAEGEVDARTSGGFVVIDGVEGDVKAGVSGGVIRIDEVHGRLEATVSGGAMSVRQRRPPAGDHDLRSSGGDIVLHLPADTDGELEAKGGRVVARLNGHLEEADGSLRRRLGAGGPRLGLVARGGDLFISSGGHS
jgi:hypothetical protein